MSVITFLGLTHADLGGGQSVIRPFKIGHLTADGMTAFTHQPPQWRGNFIDTLLTYETGHFTALRRSDSFSPSRDTLHPPGFGFRGARSPGWHPDGSKGNPNHMYLIGSDDAAMNTEYARGSAADPKLRNLPTPSPINPDAPVQQAMTQLLQDLCGIGQISTGEVMLMPIRTWHRSSPHHHRRTKHGPSSACPCRA